MASIWDHVLDGDVRGVGSMLEDGVPIDSRNSLGETPLHLAARHGLEEMATVSARRRIPCEDLVPHRGRVSALSVPFGRRPLVPETLSSCDEHVSARGSTAVLLYPNSEDACQSQSWGTQQLCRTTSMSPSATCCRAAAFADHVVLVVKQGAPL